jgi:Flp pilus assembly protein TadD
MRRLALALAAALAATAWAGAARAVLPEDRAADAPPESAPPAASPTSTVCADGRVWDDEASTCVAPESGALDDDRLFAAARELAYAGRYAEALRVAAALRDQTHPRTLTIRGFALRKSGRVEDGLALYAAALAADPGYLLARAYRGMHHVETGDRAAAAAELAEIEARGGAGSWPHAALARALAGAAPY